MSARSLQRAAGWAIASAAISLTFVAATAGAQWQAAPWALYGHESRRSTTIIIDTATGRTSTVGDVGFPAQSSGMTTALSPVMTAGGVLYPAGTVFGLFRDLNFSKDYVTTLNPTTGRHNKVVELDLSVSGRGVSFGPKGSDLYVLIPPGEIHTVSPLNGATKLLGKVLDASGTAYPGTSLALDRATGDFLAFAGRAQNTLISIDPDTLSVRVIGTLPDFTTCALAVAPGPVPGPSGTAFKAGTFFTINRTSGQLMALEVDVANLKIASTVNIGPVASDRGSTCAMAFGMRSLPTPQVTPLTPTPFPTGTAGPLPTGSAAPTGTPTPPGKTPTPSEASCVCPLLWRYAPPIIIYDALANPSHFYGWQLPLNPGKPVGPDNPRRQCLRLRNMGVPYHPLWNAPAWYSGCQ